MGAVCTRRRGFRFLITRGFGATFFVFELVVAVPVAFDASVCAAAGREGSNATACKLNEPKNNSPAAILETVCPNISLVHPHLAAQRDAGITPAKKIVSMRSLSA